MDIDHDQEERNSVNTNYPAGSAIQEEFHDESMVATSLIDLIRFAHDDFSGRYHANIYGNRKRSSSEILP